MKESTFAMGLAAIFSAPLVIGVALVLFNHHTEPEVRFVPCVEWADTSVKDMRVQPKNWTIYAGDESPITISTPGRFWFRPCSDKQIAAQAQQGPGGGAGSIITKTVEVIYPTQGGGGGGNISMGTTSWADMQFVASIYYDMGGHETGRECSDTRTVPTTELPWSFCAKHFQIKEKP